ncbi:lycopene cyclase domain-containing protein [Halorubrum laminariae]|uniref:Lycopene cyclase domain-containing protein n=1 Tax=Halorubrum laminariae TaxID=1433523 RepID=A0ABD6C192_9EURY|nr:lycopene cyclase domain-containing protein [Halorubrum laminariae]
MLPTLTYLQFHLVFSLPLIAVLWRVAPRYTGVRRRRAAAGIAVLVAIAYAYTTPWIHHMIRRGAWSYAGGAVLVRALSIPLGEYLFFAIQTVAVALACHRLGFDPAYREGDFDRLPRAVGVAVGLALVPLGLWLVGVGDRFLYLGGLLAWVGPVFALQWGVGGGYLVRTSRVWLPATLLPAAYFWVTDRIAIGVGTWRISTEFTTGVAVFGLPIEEMAFFVAAGLMTVNGIVLFEWALDWRDRRSAVDDSVLGEPSDPANPTTRPVSDPIDDR